MSDTTTVETAQELVSRIGGDQRLKYAVTPSPKALLTADSLGGQLSALAELFYALGEKDGIRLKTLIAGISTDADGTIHFDLIVTRLAD